jgi:hypothetical protein
MRFDAQTGYLAVETRQPDTLQTFFQVIDTNSGSLVIQDLEPAERWWVGLEEVAAGFLLLHGYAKKQENGEHVGLHAFEIQTNTLKWDFPGLTYLGLLSETEVVGLDENGRVQMVSIPTGDAEACTLNFQEIQTQIKNFWNSRNAALQFPEAYLPEDEYYEALQEFILQKTGMQAVKTIEYKETDRAIVLSFYAVIGEKLANFLVVCSLAGEIRLKVCLQPEAAGLGLDTFFIFAEKLFFVQEKSVVCGFLL